MERIISAIAVGLLGLACGVIAVRQFLEKGFLFNNAYLYASPRERKKLNMHPHYRQSAIIFADLTVTFLCVALGIALDSTLLFYAAIPLIAAAIVYAIVSSIRIERDAKSHDDNEER